MHTPEDNHSMTVSANDSLKSSNSNITFSSLTKMDTTNMTSQEIKDQYDKAFLQKMRNAQVKKDRLI